MSTIYELKEIEVVPGEPKMTAAFSLKDGGYIGLEDDAKRLEERGIVPELREPDHGACSIGFCEKEQKWYGWSHRAMYGFGLGSEVKHGDCAYVPKDMDDARRCAIEFWTEDHKTDLQAIDIKDEDGIPCFEVSWKFTDAVPNAKLRGMIDSVRHYPPREFGRGEWTAKTLDDAKQMAIDFAEGVS